MHTPYLTAPVPPPPPPCSNRFVDVLEESVAEWVRQQQVHTRPMSIDAQFHSAGGGGGGGGQHSDFEDDHSSSECPADCPAAHVERLKARRRPAMVV